MKLKSPMGRRALKSAVVAGTVIASISGLLLSQTPAFADDNTIFVAVGSDTTQDVINQFALDLGGNTLGSWYATNQVSQATHEVITPAKEARNADGTPNSTAAQQNCSFDRPNGSGEGQAALRLSINAASTAAVPGGANPPQVGCIDIARSSSAPGTNASTTGQLIFIPYALDDVTGASGSVAATAPTATTAGTSTVPDGCSNAAGTTTNACVATPASNLVPTTGANAGQAPGFTLAQLQAMYANGTAETATNGITYNPTGGPVALQAGQTAIDLYVPQSGSGTRNFWGTTLGFNTTTLPAWVFDHIQADGTGTVSSFVGTQVEEHDGTAVTVDPNGYMPFSVAQYIAQNNGHNARFHEAILSSVGGVAPFTGTLPNATLNTSFPINREVYNVVQFDRVVNTGDGHFDAQLAKLFVGTSSVMCRDTPTITGYGFGTLSSSTTDLCGSTAASLRAYAAI
jgi:hypothetical protein